jgi:RecB family exonuclease
MELRLARPDAAALNAAAPDVLRLLQAYKSQLAKAGLADWADVMTFATGAMKKGDATPRIIGLPILLLDVPITTTAELDFIRSVSFRTPNILATVPTGDESSLAHLRDELGFGAENLDVLSNVTAGPTSSDLGSLSSLQRHLFVESNIVKAAQADGQVLVFSAPGESRECVEIARRMLTLARDGIAFDQMAVLLRSPEQYRAHLEEAFSRAGIPAHFARGAVRPDPAGRAFYSLLCCAAEGLSARRFAEYLSLSQVPVATDEGAPPEASPREERWVAPDQELVSRPLAEALTEEAALNGTATETASDSSPVIGGQLRAPQRWERLIIDAAVIGGRERWYRRVDGLANQLRLQILELRQENEAKATVLERTLQDLKAFAAYALPIIDALDELPQSATWGEWLDKLSALATRAISQPGRVLSVLSELSPMSSVGPVTLAEILLVVSDLLLEVGVPPPGQRYGEVFVGPIEAARGLSFAAVFVPGLAEKLFPHKIVEEPILLDAARDQLKAGLTTNEERLARERLALIVAAGAAERQICFSYPRLDLEQGRPRVPSFYALEALRASEGRLPDFSELSRRAETTTSARVGWPAPSEPTAAIDNAEYDLAVLDRLFTRTQGDAGSARFLISGNPSLARALRVRWQRWSRRWTPADGLVASPDIVRAIMAQHELAARPYSATALQHYASCPYKFFLQAVQGLAPREVPDAIDELDPLQRGSLVHDVQFELFAQLRARGLLPVRQQTLSQAQQILETVVSQVAARYADDLAPAIDRVWEDGIAAIRADLREWLRRAGEDDSGYVPWHFEMSFGLKGRQNRRQADPQSVAGPVGLDCGMQLRGSIDLVERHASGSVRVTDHKTGKVTAKSGQVVAGGASLQPILYALAAEKLFKGQAKVDSGRLYFCTSAGGFSDFTVRLNKEARNAVAVVGQTIDDAIRGPFLPAAPAERNCEWCDYQPVCGPYEERRAARKPKPNLSGLLTLRELP